MVDIRTAFKLTGRPLPCNRGEPPDEITRPRYLMQQPSAEYWWIRLLPRGLRVRLQLRSNLLAAIDNSGWLLVDKIARMLIGLLVGARVARYMGPTELGQFAYVIAYLSFFQVAANLGMDGIVVRDIARERDAASAILGTTFWLRISTGFILWVSAVCGLAAFDGWSDPTVLLTALAGGTLVLQAGDTIDLWFQSQSQSRRTVKSKLIAYFTSNGIRLGLVFAHASLVAFASLVSIDALAAAIALVLAYSHFRCEESWKVVTSRALQLLRESWPFILSGLSIMIYMRIDQVMIKQMLGAESLGIYSAALPLSQSWAFIPTIITVSAAPMISRARGTSHSQYISALVRLIRLNLLIALAICCFFYLNATWLIRLLYGAKYAGTANVFSILIFVNVLLFLGISQSLWVINESARLVTLFATAVAAIAGIALNLALIPRFGLIGGCISVIVSATVSVVIIPLVFLPGLRGIYKEVLFGKRLLGDKF